MCVPAARFLLLVPRLLTSVWAVALACSVGLSAPSDEPDIGIDRRVAHVERKTFPPGHPPPHASYNPKEEAAFCDSRFGCVGDVGAEGKRFSDTAEPARLSRVNLTLTLDITVWTPKGGPRIYVEHEEHHRAISEHYYQDAEGIARRVIAEALRDLRPLAPTSNRKVLDRELRDLQRKIMDAYLDETHGRASFAQDRFDAITNHGRAAVSNASALAQALADEESHWAATHKQP